MRGRFGEWFWQWRLALAGRRLTEPGCGGCGYPVRGLTGTRCPECGAEQADVGISRPILPMASRRWRMRLRLIGWTGLIAVIGIVSGPLLLPLTPRGLSNHVDYIIPSQSGKLPTLGVRQIAYGWGWLMPYWIPREPQRAEVVRYSLLGDDGPVRYTGEIVNTLHDRYAYVFRRVGDKSQKVFESREPLSAALLVKWLAAMDVDVSADDPEIRELVRLATPRPFTERPAVGANIKVSGGPAIEPPRNGLVWVVGLWGIVWAVGFIRIFRSRRRATSG